MFTGGLLATGFPLMFFGEDPQLHQKRLSCFFHS